MSKKKIYFKRTLRIVSLLLVVALASAFLQEYILCRYDSNKVRVDGFYMEDKDSLDVVFIGASELYAGFSSVYAYEKFGFTSYPLATQSMSSRVYKTALKEVLRTQNPKLIVIEINAFLYERFNEESEEANTRKYIDNVPLNANKIKFINENFDFADRFEYYFPFLKYHSTWDEYPYNFPNVAYNLKLHNRGYSLLKGMKTSAKIFHSKKKDIINTDLSSDNTRLPLVPKLEGLLRDLLQFCKDEGLDNVVFMRMPHIVLNDKYDRFARTNTAGTIIEEYGYEFLNFERYPELLNLDIKHDFYNSDHLNIYGCEKMTEFLGTLFMRDFGIKKSVLTPQQKEKWDSCIPYYHKYYDYCDASIQAKKRVQHIYECQKTMIALEKIK
ncbi:MAG: hypothetical protein ACI4II_09830 [Acutalibacteraceae bacterium]